MNDDEMGGHVVRIEEMSAYKGLDAKPEGKTLLEEGGKITLKQMLQKYCVVYILRR